MSLSTVMAPLPQVPALLPCTSNTNTRPCLPRRAYSCLPSHLSCSSSNSSTNHGGRDASTPPHLPHLPQLPHQLSPQQSRTTSNAKQSKSSPPSPLETALSPENVGIEALKLKISAALAQKAQVKATVTTAAAASASGHAGDASDTAPESPHPLSDQANSAHSKSTHCSNPSTDSSRTVRPPSIPSYPFPGMHGSRSPRQSLQYPPLRPALASDMPPFDIGIRSTLGIPGPATLSSPGVPDDPRYPTPNLYDTILLLNANPSLGQWWSNVTDVLSHAFGAERASLALPGDVTDVEKVPWGQKATFNLLGHDNAAKHMSFVLGSDPSTKPPRVDHAIALQKRPSLQTRHSISGPAQQGSSSSISFHQKPRPSLRGASSMISSSSPASQPAEHQPSFPLSSPPHTNAVSASTPQRSHVYKILQPLNTEPDPLLLKTDVAALFGKCKPVVLTRQYSRSNSSNSPQVSSSLSVTDGTTQQSSRLENAEQPPSFHEIEQLEPEPWSQSPLPSPLAHSDPTESPFFPRMQASVDETTFEKNPPAYDYSATANQSLPSIGQEISKSLVHLPLILPVLATRDEVRSSTRRFPVAILSFLSPVHLYPRNLRQSLINLLPHLAGSFSIAQQYSELLNRLNKEAGHMPVSTAAMGGTFSDQSSELELVAELSGEIAHEEHANFSACTNLVQTPDLADTVSHSLGASSTVTPIHQYVGFSPLNHTPGGRSGSEMAEGYFTAKRHKRSSYKPATPGPGPGPGPGRAIHERAPLAKTASSRRTGNISSAQSSTDPTIRSRSSHHGSWISEIDTGDTSHNKPGRDGTESRRTSQQQSHREFSFREDHGERPLPELIASLMLNAVPLQLFLAKPTSGDLVWTNSKFDAFRGQDEGIIRDPWKNVHPEDRIGVVKLWEDAVTSGSQFTHYIRVKRFSSDSDSEFRWFVFRASTLMSSSGRLLYWIGSFLDVHEQYIKNLEANEHEATMARDAKLRALAESIPQIMFEAVEGEGLVSVNQQWQEYTGQTREDSRGMGFTAQVHPDDVFKCGIMISPDVPISLDMGPDCSSMMSPRVEDMIKSGVLTVEEDENGRISYLAEVRLRSRGGEYRWFLVRLCRVEATPASGTSGRQPSTWYGTSTDIENLKVLEHQLNLANEKVHSEMESKTKFFANMSHEIRTPLNGILGSMPWLLDSDLDHDQRRTVDIIQNSANNLRELVDNILDVTKVEAGKMALVPKWFHVRTLCEEVVDTVSSRAIERGLELNYTLEANVPATVKADPFRVRQILLNLLSNAVKFTERGEVYLKCTADTEAYSSRRPATDGSPPSAILYFEVIDTGRGFKQSDFNRLFKQFGQLGPGTNHDAGSGLGLFLSKQLVEMHGGELSVQSQAGQGSTFSFFIRVELAASGTAVSSPVQAQRVAAAKMRHDAPLEGPPPPSSIRPSACVSEDGRTRTTPMIGTEQQPIQKATVSASLHSSSERVVPLVDYKGLAGRDGPPALSGDGSAWCRSNGECDQSTLSPEVSNAQVPHPSTYSIVVICPAEHARTAIKQHIEHVVPLQIPVKVTTLATIGAFHQLINGPVTPSFTHVVLDWPASSDIMLFMRQIGELSSLSAPVTPSLAIVTDHYQKKDIHESFEALIGRGKKAFFIHKPVKPSVFARIFDPSQLSSRSKDRAREVAQSKTDQFHKITNLVRETLGKKKVRVLLVEDSPANRTIIVRYLEKVAVENEIAEDGEQCCQMVKAKPPGHYSLIICDIQMPRKNGYETCIEIRHWESDNQYPPMPIMALTANAMPEERVMAATAGFTDYLTKPVDFNLLGRMMMTLLDGKAPHTFLRERPVEG